MENIQDDFLIRNSIRLLFFNGTVQLEFSIFWKKININNVTSLDKLK